MSFIPKGIEVVQQAIAADKGEKYEEALTLYKRSLEYFMTGLKYEKNKTVRDQICKRVEGYMHRAEELKKIIDGNARKPVAAAAAPKKGKGGSGGGKDGGDDEGEDDDPEKSKLRGSLAQAIVATKPNVKWDDVAGLEGAKEALKEAVILPTQFPQLFTGKRRPWKGILLYGPPGTGKSYLAQAVATEADSTFFSVSASDLVSKWQGESEKLVRNLFEMAREKKPSIIFIDEIDSMCRGRSEGDSESSRRIMTEFLVQMQGVGKTHDGLLVLGATNTPWEIDAAMRRRFEKRVYIPLPETPARARMFGIHLGDTPNDLNEEQFHKLGEDSQGFSGSDLSVVVREALMEPLRICRTAKFWKTDFEGNYHPVETDPSCPNCHPKLSSCGPTCQGCNTACQSCGAIRKSLYDIDGDKLRAPDVTFKHFVRALKNANRSVGEDELQKYIDWTAEFGEEGC
eukprot:TRINITY_DN651_c0_g1_i1.p1 TRINITY_DN651_c0_g1~~TRINITY_DN651_c0_g1_i1.p1  ORF type:complete len:456 (+),score=207.02 TRINITY_DN651_c0_g1_i1:75-1442(+)